MTPILAGRPECDTLKGTWQPYMVEAKLVEGYGLEPGSYATTQPGVFWKILRIGLVSDVVPAGWLLALEPIDGHDLPPGGPHRVRVIDLPLPYDFTTLTPPMAPVAFGNVYEDQPDARR